MSNQSYQEAGSLIVAEKGASGGGYRRCTLLADLTPASKAQATDYDYKFKNGGVGPQYDTEEVTVYAPPWLTGTIKSGTRCDVIEDDQGLLLVFGPTSDG